MMTRRDFVQTAASAGAATALSGCAAPAVTPTPLQWKHFPAGAAYATVTGDQLAVHGWMLEDN